MRVAVCLIGLCAGMAVAEPPRCDVLAGVRGGPALVINGEVFSPLIFMANNQFGRDEVLLDEIRQWAAAGIKLFGFQAPLDWFATPSEAAALVARFCAAYPDGYFLVQMWLGPNREWAEQHPDECITKMSPDGSTTRLHWASPSSALWRETTRTMLVNRVREIAEGPHGRRLAGVMVDYLQTGEWFYPDTDDFMDYSPANLKAFRAWLKKRYGNEKRLRAAWNEPDAGFDTVTFPAPTERDAPGAGPFRTPRQAAAADMDRFQSELMADTIACFARAVKEATSNRTLVGAYYGYTFELSHNGPRALVHSGHLALARLLECRDLDLLQAPFSYFERGVGQPGHLHGPVSSMALHGKLVLCEEDVYTHLAKEPENAAMAPGWEQRTTNLAETRAVVLRDFGNIFGRGGGMWFLDLLSDGRWLGREVMEDVPLLRRMSAELRSTKPFTPEVAVVADERSPPLMQATTHPYLLHTLAQARAELDRLGTPIGYYLLTDLALLPKSVKVVVLPNAVAFDRPTQRALDALFARGATVLFLFMPDIAGPEGLDSARMARAVSMAVEVKNERPVSGVRSEWSDETISFEPPWSVRVVVTEPGADVVARYPDTGEVAAAAVKKKRGVSVCSGAGRLPLGVLREICARAGVHFYVDGPGSVSVVGPYLIVHMQTQGRQIVKWPRPWTKIERIVPAGAAPSPGEQPQSWVDSLPGGTTAVYRVTE